MDKKFKADIEEIAFALEHAPPSEVDDPNAGWDSCVDHSDQDSLLGLGFHYGASYETMFGRDYLGNEWCVWLNPKERYPVWYIVTKKGTLDRVGTMHYSELKTLFDNKKK